MTECSRRLGDKESSWTVTPWSCHAIEVEEHQQPFGLKGLRTLSTPQLGMQLNYDTVIMPCHRGERRPLNSGHSAVGLGMDKGQSLQTWHVQSRAVLSQKEQNFEINLRHVMNWDCRTSMKNFGFLSRGEEGLDSLSVLFFSFACKPRQQRPESPTVTLTWHACKYKVHKLHYWEAHPQKGCPPVAYTLHFRHTRRQRCAQA